jgi:hypothetical protein
MRHKRLDRLERDGNGDPFELVLIGGVEVVVRYADVPESDVTVVDGLRCTTPLRTVLDLAPQVDREQLVGMVEECLGRHLFTVADALHRIAQTDMADRPGARLVASVLAERGR